MIFKSGKGGGVNSDISQLIVTDYYYFFLLYGCHIKNSLKKTQTFCHLFQPNIMRNCTCFTMWQFHMNSCSAHQMKT